MKRIQYTILLLLFKNHTPTEIIKAGYPTQTVYDYKTRFPDIMRDFRKAREKIKYSKLKP